MQTREDRYFELVRMLNRYSFEYHALDNPTVSDDIYDSLFAELKQIEEENPDIISKNSPSQRVGNVVSDKFEKVEHKTRMLSLNDVFSFDDVKKWFARIKKINPNLKEEFFADIKMDGLACSLIYENGEFVRGVTRGDSFIGEDVSVNIRTIKNIPMHLSNSSGIDVSGRVEVRGEILIFRDDFAKINSERRKNGEPEFANPRNLAAGTIRQLDSSVVASRPLKFIAYDLLVDESIKSQKLIYENLSNLGFSVNSQAGEIFSLEELKDFVEKWNFERNKLPFNTDGLVVKVGSRQDFLDLGIVGKNPRGAIAYKYAAETATAVIKDIEISIGRTGVATPVAVFEPVNLAGTTVRNASLHNADEIARKDIRIGDTVIIFKAGDIIPQVERVIFELRPKNSRIFDYEECLRNRFPDSEFERLDGEVAYRMKSGDSNIILKKKLTYYASKSALNIENLGEKNVELLVDSGLISDLADIYALKIDDLLGLERFADLSSNNLIVAIQNSKTPTLHKFLVALGIRYVGDKTAKDLSKSFGGIESIAVATAEDFLAIDGIGEKVAFSVVDWFRDEENIKLLNKMRDFGVKPQADVEKSGKLSGFSFVVTGTLDGISREKMAEIIVENGGEFQKSVTKNTNFLIAGGEVGVSKISKAEKLGVRVISQSDFEKML